MNLEEIREIIALMNKNDIAEFEMERDGFKLSLKKGGAPLPPAVPSAPPPAAPAPVAEPAPVVAGPPVEEILSPMVGTFYTAPSPDSPPYVQAGQDVTAEDVVCIIEAMKVMNEIKAEVRGKIIEVLASSGEPVEFGQPLFRVQLPSS